MKLIIQVMLGIFLSSSVQADTLPAWMKKDGWVTFHEVCSSMNRIKGTKTDCSKPTQVIEKKLLPSWAAETVAMYFNVDKNTFIRFKLKITWKTDATNLKCNDIIQKTPNELKDFTHRSLAMTKCN